MPNTTERVARGSVGRTFTETIVVGGLTSSPGAPNTATFRLRQGDTLVEKAATVGTVTFNAGTGEASIPLTYTSSGSDLDIPLGGWRQNWKLAWNGGATIYEPEDGSSWVEITDNLTPPA